MTKESVTLNTPDNDHSVTHVLLPVPTPVPVPVPVAEFWSAVFGAEPFIWPWWVAVKYDEGCDWETPGTVTLTIADPDDAEDSTTKTITVDDLVAAYTTALTTCVDPCTGKPPFWDDLDSCTSDCILQIAVQGEVVFA